MADPQIKIDRNEDTRQWEAWLENDIESLLLARGRSKKIVEGSTVRVLMRILKAFQDRISDMGPSYWCATCEIVDTMTQTCPKCEGAMRPLAKRRKSTPRALDPALVLGAFQGAGEWLSRAQIRATLQTQNIEPLPTIAQIGQVLREQTAAHVLQRDGNTWAFAEGEHADRMKARIVRRKRFTT